MSNSVNPSLGRFQRTEGRRAALLREGFTRPLTRYLAQAALNPDDCQPSARLLEFVEEHELIKLTPTDEELNALVLLAFENGPTYLEDHEIYLLLSGDLVSLAMLRSLLLSCAAPPQPWVDATRIDASIYR